MAKPKFLSVSEIPFILEFDCLGTSIKTYPSKTPGGEPFVTTKVTGAFPSYEVDEAGRAIAVPAIAELDLQDGIAEVAKGKRTVLISVSSYLSKGMAKTSLKIKKVIK